MIQKLEMQTSVLFVERIAKKKIFIFCKTIVFNFSYFIIRYQYLMFTNQSSNLKFAKRKIVIFIQPRICFEIFV